MSFSEMLKAKIGDLALADVATTMGVALPGLRKAVAGKSVPNARSLDKYAAFLGISTDEAKALVLAAKASAPVKGKGGRKAKAAKAPKTETEGKAKPGRKAKGGRKAMAKAGKGSSDLAASLGLIAEAIAKAETILADPLVNRLYSLEGAKRKAAEAILGSVL
jgi:hypothetical protein